MSGGHSPADQLRGLGLRATPARVAVLEELDRSATHLSAAALHARITGRLPSVHLATAHRAVLDLHRAGLLHVLPAPGETLYGRAEDPHDHAVCLGCGLVVELDRLESARARDALATLIGFRVGPGGLGLTGRCRDCAAPSAE